MILVLLVTLTTSSFSDSNSEMTDIDGKWYYMPGGLYTNVQKNGSSNRWYSFNNNTITYSTCTDMCGCMRHTLYGKYVWKNDSTIDVTYYKEDRQMAHASRKLKEPRKAQLKIVRIDAHTIEIIQKRHNSSNQ